MAHGSGHDGPCSDRRAATTAADARTGDCGYGTRSVAYHYRSPGDHPTWRATAKGLRDQAIKHQSLRKVVVDHLVSPDSPTLGWKIVDSFNHQYAWLQEVKVGKYKLFDEAGNLVGSTTGGRAKIRLQGYGCMTTDADSKNHAIIYLDPHGGVSAPDSSGNTHAVDLVFRGFIRLAQLPSDDRTAVTQNKGALCHTQPTYRATASGGPAFARHSFQTGVDMYQGHLYTGSNKCKQFSNGGSPPQPYDFDHNPSCGGQYHDYSRPEWDTNVAIVTTATTGVQGGGVVRGIIALDQAPANAVRRVDYINYVDENVPCTRSFVTQWLRVDINAVNSKRPIYGWVPEGATSPGGPRNGGQYGCP